MIYVFSMINLIFQSQRDNLHVSAQVSRDFQVRRKKNIEIFFRTCHL